MKLTIYSPDSLPAQPRKGVRFKSSLMDLLCVNPLYGRVYFSSSLAKRFVHAKSFLFGRNPRGTWFLIPCAKDSGFKLNTHEGSWYFVHRPLVNEFVKDFGKDDQLFFSVHKEAYRIDGYDGYKIETESHEEVTRKGNSKRPYRKRENRNPSGESLGRDLRALLEYTRTDFPGRVKTQQMLLTEQRVLARAS